MNDSVSILITVLHVEEKPHASAGLEWCLSKAHSHTVSCDANAASCGDKK